MLLMEGTRNNLAAAGMIKIKLITDDIGKGFYIELNKSDVEEHVVKHWNPTVVKRATIDDIKVSMQDLDTNSEHEVNFRYYKHVGSYFLQGLWHRNFVDRRKLMAGDEIGIACIPGSSHSLCFCVLKRSGGNNNK